MGSSPSSTRASSSRLTWRLVPAVVLNLAPRLWVKCDERHMSLVQRPGASAALWKRRGGGSVTRHRFRVDLSGCHCIISVQNQNIRENACSPIRARLKGGSAGAMPTSSGSLTDANRTLAKVDQKKASQS